MRIVSRAEWGAITEQARPAMHLPAREVWLHHSVTQVSTNPNFDMRLIQRIGISRFGYLSYSYAIHPKGTILEGQGGRVGAHTAGRNSTSLGVVLIGDYTTREPTDAQVDAFHWLMAHLQADGHLRPGIYPTGGHRDLAATACPGNHAYALIPEFRRKDPPPVTPPIFSAPVLVGTDHRPTIIVARPQGDGYWIVSYDGGVFAFGNAPSGPLTAIGGGPVERIISAVAWPDGLGLLAMGEDGGVFALGTAVYYGRVDWTRDGPA